MPKQSMKVWELKEFGLSALKQTEQPIPTPGPHELLVRINAVSLNYRDKLVVEGVFIPDLKLPFTPASDAVGEVVSVGEGVTRFRVGDRVMSAYIPGWNYGDGSGPEGDYLSIGGPLPGVLAEYRVFDEQSVVATPSYLTDHEASTLPIAAVTAWTALFDQARLEPGQTILIEGTGGVSIFALQLAKATGARAIVTSSSDEKLARAKALGADAGINYAHHPDWEKQVLELTSGRGADIIIEVAGGDNVRHATAAAARNGHIALIGLMDGFSLTADIPRMLAQRIAIRSVLVGSRRSFERLNDALEITRIHPVIDKVYPFSETVAAFEHLNRGPFGKVVIDARE